MATRTTAQYDLQAADRANPARKGAPNVSDGEVEFMSIPYTVPASGAIVSGDLLRLCVLPAGAIPLPSRSNVTGTTGISLAGLDIGTAADPDGWADGMTVTTLRVECCAPVTPAWEAATPLVADTGSGNAIVYATVTTVTTATAGAVIYFNLAFKRGR